MSAVPSPGRLIAQKYRLLERVGTGGMSEVYRAEELGAARTVAVKVLLPHKLDDPSFVARLFQEAASGRRIRHSGIVQIHDAGQSEYGPFLVMDFLNGENAGRRLLDHGPFSVPQALATVLPILEVLQAVHDAGVIHRDVKPGNVFYSVTGPRDVAVKLLDFGVAKVEWPTGTSPRTSTGVVMGTPDYLSPEQANGEHSVDGRSDVFSAAVVLFELLTGVRPFHAATAIATAYRVAHGRAPRLEECGAASDPKLQAILDRAMAKRPDERHSGPRELAAELEVIAPTADERRRVLAALVQPERFWGRTRAESGERESVPRSERRPSVPPLPSAWPGAAPAPSEERPPENEVRGVVLRAIDGYLRQVFGEGARQRVLSAVPTNVAAELRYGSMQAIVPYDVTALNHLCDRITTEAAMGNPGWARAAGAHAVRAELAPLIRPALASTTPDVVVRRLIPCLARFYSFGTWDYDDGHAVSTLHINDMQPLNAPARSWLVGVIEGAIAAAGGRARVTLVRGDAAYAPQLAVDVVAG
jgi:serine/threonine-protein kinase